MFKKFLWFVYVCIAVCLSFDADAAGYQLTEYSVSGMGRAHAGMGIVGDDYSALAFNPAGMVLKGTGGQIGYSAVQQYGTVKGYTTVNNSLAGRPGVPPTVPASRTYTGKADVSVLSSLPNMFVQYKINDTFTAGLGVYAPFGLATDYDDDWFAASDGLTTDMTVLDVTPALAVRLNDQWSVGAGFIFRYVRGKITNTVQSDIAGSMNGFSKYDLDGWNHYGIFGVMYEYSKDTRFGLSYRTTRKHKVKGDHEITGAVVVPGFNLNGDFDGLSVQQLPEHVLFSAFTKQGKFGYSFSARWTRWTRFQDFTLYSSQPMLASVGVDYKWRNSWTLSLGTDYDYSDRLTLRGGIAYDQAPVPSEKYRTIRIPDQDRIWLSFGFSYAVKKNVKMDIGFSHLFMKTYHALNAEKSVRGDVTSTPSDVKYDAGANIVGIQFQFDL